MTNSWLRSPPIGPEFGAHRDGLQAEPRERPEISDEHTVIRGARALVVEIEGVGVLHQEFATAHDAEAGTHLVAELPLDVIEVQRQVAIRPDVGAKDVGDHLLVGRAVEHVALVPVDDPKHLLAVVVIAAALAPEVGRLDGRHQHLQRARPVLFLAHDRFDPLQDADAERQPGIDAGCLLPEHSRPQHQPVRDDLRLLRCLLQDRAGSSGRAA